MVNEPKKSGKKSMRLYWYRKGWSDGARGESQEVLDQPAHARGLKDGKKARERAMAAEIKRLKITKAELNRWVLR